MTRLASVLLASSVFLCLGRPHHGLAQNGPGAAPSRGPGWLRRTSRLHEQNVKFTAAEMATTLNRLKEIERILLQVPELASPDGFEVAPGLHGGGDPQSTGRAISSNYDLMFFSPSQRIAGEGSNCISVSINHLHGADQLPYSDGRGNIHLEHELGPLVPGATRAWQTLSPSGRSWTYLLFSAAGKSPWMPVTREGYLKAVIGYAEGKDGEVLATLRRARAETSYRRWLAAAPQRKAQWEATAAAQPPTEAAKMRTHFEQAEREATESLKVGEASELEEIDGTLARITQQATRWRARIAAMSPAERSATAWLDRMDARGETFVEPNSPLSQQVVQEDSGYFKARRSRIEARNIVVRLSTSLTCETAAVRKVIWQVYQKLDWAALARLVEPS